MKHQSCLLLLWFSVVLADACTTGKLKFHQTTGMDCVNSSFFNILEGLCTAMDCSYKCAMKEKCQAFRLLTNGTCQCKLFLFDACSHRVQSVPNCTNQVTVYVRSLAGVPPGRLCPPGYQYTKYGTSYKVFTATQLWAGANQSCSSELGLSKFVDIVDLEEAVHVGSIKQLVGSSMSYHIGGYQKSGAPNVNTNWFWAACNTPISASVWHSGEPNNGVAGGEGCTNFWYTFFDSIDDNRCTNNQRYFCECQSVF